MRRLVRRKGDGVTPFRDMNPDQEALARLMGDISEDHWCAGWLIGNENALWAMAIDGASPEYGDGTVSAERLARLRELSEKTGGWVVFGDKGEAWLPLSEWEKVREPWP